jgi:uncharacterized protein (DUF924 family)
MEPLATANDVLDFWFGDGSAARAEWFRKDPAFDAQIARRFGPTIERALAGDLAGWSADARSTLAQIIVLDQFTRNTLRDTARAFDGDGRALVLARHMVERGWDRQLTPLQRWFAYLPFEHAEDLGAQLESLRLFESLSQDDASLQAALDYARRHHAVIVRFGRYPHRNAQLGRASTAEEAAYLREPGSGF